MSSADRSPAPAGFVDRHIGPDPEELQRMLSVIGVSSLDELAHRVIPAVIADELDSDVLGALPKPIGEREVLDRLAGLAAKNSVKRSMIGLGYYGTHTPGVILRNVLENPAWYTAYTPYQPEISQGRLEALLNFQTMVADLTGMEVANASMLDEATAAAEAMTLLRRAASRSRRASSSTPTSSRRPAPSSRPGRSRSGSRWSRRLWTRPRRSTACPTASSSA